MSSTCPPTRDVPQARQPSAGMVPIRNAELPSTSMPKVLVATDAEWVRNEVHSVLSAADTTVDAVTSGQAVLPAVQDDLPDLVILDLQIGNMGGMAVLVQAPWGNVGGSGK